MGPASHPRWPPHGHMPFCVPAERAIAHCAFVVPLGSQAGHAVSGGHISGMFGFFFCEGPVKCFADAAKSDTDKFARWHRGMLERGVYLAPSQYEAGFMSLAHSDADVDHTIAMAKEVFAEI